MIRDFERQTIVDDEHLRLLTIGYRAWGGFQTRAGRARGTGLAI